MMKFLTPRRVFLLLLLFLFVAVFVLYPVMIFKILLIMSSPFIFFILAFCISLMVRENTWIPPKTLFKKMMFELRE